MRTHFCYPLRHVLLGTVMLMLWSPNAQAQTGTVSGTILDESGAPLVAATAVLLTASDSSMVAFGISGPDGTFRLGRAAQGAYVLQVSFVGYAIHLQGVTIAQDPVQLDPIRMQLSVVEAGELVVSSERIPMVVTADTVAFNAAAFRVRPNASVEDLLKRLPGVEVEEDGQIKAMGEEVSRVYVDGKEFFGNDPTIATRNLPADAVDQVQIYDRASDQAAFTGVDDGQREKTINLELRDDAKQGAFGNASGGYGDPSRYDVNASINRFTAETQLSLLANFNNINRQGFSFRDYVAFLGGFGALSGRGGAFEVSGVNLGTDLSDGFSTTTAVGLNASRDLNSTIKVRSSYFYSGLTNEQQRDLLTEQLLGTRQTAKTTEQAFQEANNSTHRVNITLSIDPSDRQAFELRGSGSRSGSDLQNASDRLVLPSDQAYNRTVSQYDSEGGEVQADASMRYRRKLGQSETSLVTEASWTMNDSDTDASLEASQTALLSGDVLTYTELAQLQARMGTTMTDALRVSLNRNVANHWLLELGAEQRRNHDDSNQRVFDLIGASPVINQALSQRFEQTYTYRTGEARLRFSSETWRAGIAATVQAASLSGVYDTGVSATGFSSTQILLSADARYDFGTGRSLGVRYRGSTREPSLTELQPYEDNTDPQNVYVGNPLLTAERSHNVSASYNLFDQFSFINVFVWGNARITSNPIVSSRIFSSTLAQTRQPVNLIGETTKQLSGNINFSAPIRALAIKVSLSNNLMQNWGKEVINLETSESITLRNSTRLEVENRNKDWLDVGLSGQFSYNKATYALNGQLSETYLNQSYRARAGLQLGESWRIDSDIRYQIYDERERAATVDPLTQWDATLYHYRRDGKIELSLSAVDMLDQRVGITINNLTNGVSQETIPSLGRFIMFRIRYNLSELGPQRGPRRGMINIDMN